MEIRHIHAYKQTQKTQKNFFSETKASLNQIILGRKSVWVVLIEKCIQLVKIPSKISPLLKKKMVKLAKLALFEAMDIIVKDVYKL